MSLRTLHVNNALSTDPIALRHKVFKKNRKLKDREIELSPELRFPGDIPNPMIPHRVQSRTGSSPLSHYERYSLVHARYDVDESGEE